MLSRTAPDVGLPAQEPLPDAIVHLYMNAAKLSCRSHLSHLAMGCVASRHLLSQSWDVDEGVLCGESELITFVSQDSGK